MRRLLILGGTAEATELARALAARLPALDVTTSWAGRTGAMPDVPGGVRIGGFGGADGLETYLRAEGFDLLVDATHPFAQRISAHAAEACGRAGVPRLVLARPPWEAVAGDRWIEAADMDEAARLLPGLGRRPFLSIGVQELPAFAGISDMRFLVRVAVPASVPVACELVVARGPFAEEDERRLMREKGVDVLVAKNSGGASTYAKIEAARALDLPVLMIRRPPPVPGKSAPSVEAALEWLAKAVSQAAPDWA